MKKTQKHTKFKLTEDLINKFIDFIDTSNDKSIKDIFIDFHHADIAEILEELNSSQATYIIKLLDSEKTSDVLMELDDDYREKILKNLSIKEIAEEVEELDTDDATDIILELPEEKQKKVISKIVDAEHKADIKELLKYEENSAGSLMAKEDKIYAPLQELSYDNTILPIITKESTSEEDQKAELQSVLEQSDEILRNNHSVSLL